MTSRLRLQLVGVAALATAASSAHAEDEPLDREPVTCINVSRFQRMEAADDQTLLFHLSGDRVYRNTLHQRCPNIDRPNTNIAYEATSRLARLCANDLVKTTDGLTCRLGQFAAITPAEARELMASAAGKSASAVSSSAAPPPDDSRDEVPPGGPPANEDRPK